MSEEKDQKEQLKASQDQVALEMMKFIAVTTGYGKGAVAPAAGFGGKAGGRSAEEYADSLLDLFKKCRDVVRS